MLKANTSKLYSDTKYNIITSNRRITCAKTKLCEDSGFGARDKPYIKRDRNHGSYVYSDLYTTYLPNLLILMLSLNNSTTDYGCHCI